MSSSPTAPTSTTASSSSSPFPDRADIGRRTAVIACGALARHVSDIAARTGLPLDLYPLAPLLHNRPERIAAAVETAFGELGTRYARVVIAYADCGTYGALAEVCERLGVPMLRGAHCYDVFAGTARMQSLLEQEPGTYVLTDFLVRSFQRSVVVELGLDRHPELREDYFRHYHRVVWLAQHPTPELQEAATCCAKLLGLPLEVIDVGDVGLERELRAALDGRR